ncbi:MAG: pyridoxamine 5'-phosphate oxidase family protein [Sporomusaceae bacterium]|nr:pyridoxamine 5'-phosphate oxidase family protein [Sporomusaceae bacterium]
MRRKPKQMSDEDTVKVLLAAAYGTLASVDSAGQPYAVPLNYAYADGAIYFHSARQGHKLDTIRACPQVCFSAVSYQRLLPANFDTEYDSVTVFGRAEEVSDEAEKQQALLLLIEKYSGEFREQGLAYIQRAAAQTGVVKLIIEHMTGKRGR